MPIDGNGIRVDLYALPDLEYVIGDCSPKELGAVQTGLAIQVFQSLELLLGEPYLRDFLCHSALHSDSVCASWILDCITKLRMSANATIQHSRRFRVWALFCRRYLEFGCT